VFIDKQVARLLVYKRYAIKQRPASQIALAMTEKWTEPSLRAYKKASETPAKANRMYAISQQIKRETRHTVPLHRNAIKQQSRMTTPGTVK